MRDDIVCWENVERYYSNKPALVEKYKKIMKSGNCPFCPGNIEREFRFVGRTSLWNIVHNQFPYPNLRVHLLITPKYHLTSLSGPWGDQAQEWAEMGEVIGIVGQKYPFLSKGYGLALRVEETGGVTLYHLHFHIIIPKIDPETGQIPVNFGIG